VVGLAVGLDVCFARIALALASASAATYSALMPDSRISFAQYATSAFW
jgi:hypothetical protein